MSNKVVLRILKRFLKSHVYQGLFYLSYIGFKIVRGVLKLLYFKEDGFTTKVAADIFMTFQEAYSAYDLVFFL